MNARADLRSIAFADSFLVPFEEAIAYHRQKVNLPTSSWRDLEGRSHDRAFVVAGAMKEALLADLRAEIDKAIAGKLTLEEFRANFDEIVQRHGWTGWRGENSAAGRAWRTKTIFQTNLTTAYAAGRYRQMTDPDIVKVYKWWRYRHAFYRTPEQPRPEHVSWNGLVLRWDDEWWKAHYPPNDWNCSCGVETLSDRDLKAEGIEPGEAPADTMRTVRDPKTGENVEVPNGIGFGWNHTPGRDWSQGLVPPPLQNPLRPSIGPVRPDAQPDSLLPQARPFQSELMPDGLEPKAYVDAFLGEFGASVDVGKIWRDPSGHAIAVSDQLFRDGRGSWKIPFQGRENHVLRLAEAIKDPDEIWLDWALDPAGRSRLVRRYLRTSPDSPEFAAFAWSNAGWYGATAFSPKGGRLLLPDPGYLERQRRGALIWKRPEEK